MTREPAKRRVSRGTLLRFLLLPALLAAGFAALRWTPLGHQFTAERVAALVAAIEHAWWSPLALFAGYAVLSPLGVPATPLIFAGSVVFGAARGALYNCIGVYGGAVSNYFLGRLLGRDFIVQIAGRRLKKVERAIAQRGFWGMVAVRFLPLPFAVVNYCAALAGVRPHLFLTSTALGIVPTVTLYTYFFATLARAGAARRQEVYWQLGLSILLLFLATTIPQLIQARRRRARYRQVCELRSRRAIAT